MIRPLADCRMAGVTSLERGREGAAECATATLLLGATLALGFLV
jgi:hypothetical protein